MSDFDVDCLIVGGGPAGLTAAIYLSRYHLALKVVDAGKSRAGWIPCTHNHAGFPDGVSGAELLRLMREQAQKYGATIETGRVTRLDALDGGGFEAEWGSGRATARAVLLATGVTNRRPQVDEDLHEQALAEGLIRYCPICDGFEVTDCNIAVIGDEGRGLAEARFLRGYSETVTLLGARGAIPADERRDAEAIGITCVDGPSSVVAIDGKSIVVEANAKRLGFDTVYPALGSDTHVELAVQTGAATAEADCIIVDSHQRTSVPGLYAAGDVVLGLDQISHAMGEGGVAATTIRNDLAKEKPILRENLRGNSIR